MKTPRITAKGMTRFHAAMTVLWGLLIIPSLLWWSQSVPWLVLISVYANLAGHFGAYQASRAEQNGN